MTQHSQSEQASQPDRIAAASGSDAEVKELLNGVATRLHPSAVGTMSAKQTLRVSNSAIDKLNSITYIKGCKRVSSRHSTNNKHCVYSLQHKSAEFNAKLMGVQIPELSDLTKGWKEHDIIAMARDEVNGAFSEVPITSDAEKRFWIPSPPTTLKCQAVSPAPTLTGIAMNRLPHSMRENLPQGTKIEVLEIKESLPKAVKDDLHNILWNAVSTQCTSHILL